MPGGKLLPNLRAASMFWYSFALPLLICFSAALAQSQQGKETQKPSDEDEVVRLRTHLVNVDVIVRDRKGKYVTDLKAEDFTVFENGVRQTVEFFDPPLVGDETGRSDAVVASQRSRTPTGLPRHIISLVLDGQTTEQTNLKRVREGMLKYIRERVSDADTVAVFAVSNGLQLLQPFTQDKAKLIAAVENASSVSTPSKTSELRGAGEEIARLREVAGGGDSSLAAAQAGGPGATAAGSSSAQAMIASRALQQFIKLRSALSLQQSRPVLAALAAICEAQRAIPGKKTLVLFSQGFVTPETLDWQVQSTVDIANRANVAVYIIDAAGLTASAPKSGSYAPASPLDAVSAKTGQEQRIQAVGGETVFDHVRQEGLNREQDILYRISGDTGGKFLKGNNDIAQGLSRIDDELRSRYTLAYHSTNSNFDGSFRKLKIGVGRPDTEVVSRPGFYAIAADELVPLSPEEKKLLASVSTAETAPGLPLFVDASPFKVGAGRYLVPLSFEVPPGAVKFERKDGKQRMHLEVLGVIRDMEEKGKILSRLGGSFDVGLSAEQYQAILTNNIFYRQDVELTPGTYTIELILRDRLSGKTAARTETLTLPDADAEFSTSGVILSRHAEPARKTLPATASSDVLTHAGAQIRPSPAREFHTTDNLIIFFDLYNAATQAETGAPLVRVTLTLMRENQPAMRPIDYVLTDTVPDPVPHLTFARYLSLAALTPGKYTANIEARDMVTRKLVKQQASFVIIAK